MALSHDSDSPPAGTRVLAPRRPLAPLGAGFLKLPHPQGVSLDPPAFSPGTTGRWECRFHRQAGEATAWYVETPAERGPLVRRARGFPERPEEIAADSARRAKAEMRRYIAGWGLDHLWGMTNTDVVYEWREIERRKEKFLERLAADRWNLPIVLIAEPHPLGHGYHLHFAAPVFLPIGRVRAWWPYGIVRVSGPRGGRRGAWEPRRLGGYLGKYLTKQLDADELHGCEPRPAGAHRYWKRRGFELVEERLTGATAEEIEEALVAQAGKWEAREPFGGSAPYRPEGFWYRFRLPRRPAPSQRGVSKPRRSGDDQDDGDAGLGGAPGPARRAGRGVLQLP